MHTFKTITLALLLIIFSVVPLVPILSSVANAGENTKYRLIVNATPSDSRIRIMNIKPKYRYGIALKSGKYDIEVTRSGYESKRGWVEIKDADRSIDVILNKLGSKEPQAEEMSLEQFENEFITALQSQNDKKIEELFINHPNTTEQYQRLLTRLGEGVGEEAEQARALAALVGEMRQALASWQSFVKEFFVALQAKDYEKIRQLFINNPETAKQFQLFLANEGKGVGKIAEEYRALAGLVAKWIEMLSLPDIQELNRLQEEGEKAFYRSDYPTALKKWEQGLNLARQAKNEQAIGMFIGNIGMVYKNLGDYPKALNYYQQALAIHQELGHKRGEGSVLKNIGLVYQNFGQYQTALDYYQQALTIHREIKDKREEGGDLTNIGTVYMNLRQYRKALDYCKKSIVIHKAIGNKEGIGRNLTNIGLIYNNLGEYSKALEYYEQALVIKRQFMDKKGEANVLVNIGPTYWNLGQYNKALGYLEKSLVIYRELDDKGGEANSFGNIGLVYGDLGEYSKALDYFKKSLVIQKQIGNKKGIGNILGNISAVYFNLGQYNKALDYSEQSLVINREIKDKGGEGSCFGNIGLVYSRLGQYNKALGYHEQALVIFREIGHKKEEGMNLSNIGNVYSNLGQYSKTLDYFEQALVIHRKIGNKKEVGINLGNFGNIYRDLGQYNKALDYFEQALVIHRNIGNKKGEGANLNNIALIYADSKQYNKALDYHEQAIAISREIADKGMEAANLLNIGNIYSYLGQYRKSLDFSLQALKIDKKLGNKKGEGVDLLNIGVVYEHLNQYKDMRDYLQNSVAIFETIALNEVWRAQSVLAFAQAKLHEYNAAITHYEQALDNIEKLRAGLTDKEHKISFMYRKLPVYDELIALLQSLHSNHPKKGYDRKAIEIFERKQGRVFLEEMGKSGARRFAGIPENILQNETERVQKIAAARNSHLEALAQGKNAEPHRKRLEKLQAEQAEFEKTLQTNYPAYYALKYPKPVALKTLQKNVLQADELMLIYNIREEATDLWVVGKEHFASFILPLTAEQMQQQVTQFRDVGIESMLNEIDTAKQRRLKDTALMRHLAGAVDENLPDFVETSDALYQQLLPEAARQLVAKAKPSTLYIVPTGALYSLPFESLVTAPDEDEPHYLIQDYAIAYLSSASLLKTLRESQHRREIMEREPLLAFADPVYSQKSCQALNQGDSIKGLRTRAYKKLLGGEGICFPPLPETADEVKAIAQLFHVDPYSQPKPLHLQEEASVETIELFNEDEELDDFQYVLFSTHAILPDEVSYITQPALVLSHPEKNGYLKMADVFGLKMNADLVMLSACNTGRGYTFKGEGVRGLTRAFMYAGTPAVAVTLWSVESLASQQLGIHLFTQLKNKQPLAKGLRQAKLAMLKNDNSHYRHPYFWAGFVVFGDGL